MSAEISHPPPTRPRRLWLQYSLRSLFVLTAICAIGAAGLGYKVEQKRKENEVVDALRALGAAVNYDYMKTTDQKPSGPEWMRRFLGEHFFDEIESVSITSVPVKPEYWEYIGSLTALKRLRLDDIQATDADLEYIKGLTRLTSLSLYGNRMITDTGVAHLKGLTQLEWLNLGYSEITDAGLEQLTGMTRLVNLVLRGSKNVTGEGYERLKRALPNLE